MEFFLLLTGSQKTRLPFPILHYPCLLSKTHTDGTRSGAYFSLHHSSPELITNREEVTSTEGEAKGTAVPPHKGVRWLFLEDKVLPRI